MIRAVVIIAVLLLGWLAMRAETFAHSAPAPSASLQQPASAAPR